VLSNAEYPIAYQAQYAERRNRASIFFRGLLVIPQFVFLCVLAIALLFTIPISWLVLLFTGRYPQGLYAFHAGIVEFSGRLCAYLLLQTDEWPGFTLGEKAGYPVQVTVGPRQESYSRWKVLLRYFLTIPFSIVAQVYLLVSFVIAIGAWFIALVTGRVPEEMHKLLNWGAAAQTRVLAYGTFLLTDEWPPFEPDSGDTPALPPPPAASLTAPEAP
jgi:hypothetical protein